jgi:hypothetical protein
LERSLVSLAAKAPAFEFIAGQHGHVLLDAIAADAFQRGIDGGCIERDGGIRRRRRCCR